MSYPQSITVCPNLVNNIAISKVYSSMAVLHILYKDFSLQPCKITEFSSSQKQNTALPKPCQNDNNSKSQPGTVNICFK